MISNTPYFQKNTKPTGQAKNLVGVRGAGFYGLKYEKLKLEQSSYKRGIVASPNFYFYDNFTKVMIDFSDYKNQIDQEVIDEYFTLSLSGVTFSVSQGDWINDFLTDKKISMSGTYVYSEYKNKILFANVSSVQYYDSNVTRYDKNYFINTPNFIMNLNSIQKNENQTNIVNIFGTNSKNSFKYLGAQIGDYILISNQKQKYQINNISVDQEGKEIITVNGTIPPEDRTSSITDIVLYVENTDNTDISVLSETKIGRCNVLKNGLIFCNDNQTEAQCQLRKNSNNKETASFTQNTFCDQVTNTSLPVTETQRLALFLQQNRQIASGYNISNLNY